jgi:hypothetical protein
MFETITPAWRDNTLDPEVRNPVLEGRRGVVEKEAAEESL